MTPTSSAASSGTFTPGAAPFEQIFTSQPHSVLVLSRDLIIQTVSDTYLEATLTKREKIIGRYVFEVFPDNPHTPHANAVRNLKASLERVLQTKKPHAMPVQHYDVPDPQNPGKFVERYWSPLNWPVLDEKGEITCLVHQVTNVTDQIKTEGLLQESQVKEQQAWQEVERQRARLHDLLMQAPAAICVLDGPDLVFELVNPGFQAWFPGRELLGKPVRQGLSEIVGQPIAQILAQVYQTGQVYHGQEVLIQLARQEGGALDDSYFNFVYQPRRNALGEVDGILVFAYEVTELVVARKRVEESQQRFQMLSESVPQLVWTATPEGSVEYYNSQWYAYTGLAENQSLGKGWQAVIHREDLPTLLQHWQEGLLTGKPCQAEARLKSAEGTYRWFLFRARPLTDAKGQIRQWVGTNTDIDEHKEAEAALQQLSQELTKANVQLRRLNVDLDNFVYTASHDLRSPVNNLEGLQDLLFSRLTHKLDEKEQTLLQHMRTVTGQLKATLADLSSIAKLQQELDQPLKSVSFQQIVEEVTVDLSVLITQTGAQLEVDFQVASIEYPRAHLRSILYNLLSNALKYRAPRRQPRVEIATGSEGGQVRLSVRDNGLGIPQEQFDKVFAVFKRIHPQVEGSGVGLYMVKRMVENHGGRITFQSQLGVGTTFSVYFQA